MVKEVTWDPRGGCSRFKVTGRSTGFFKGWGRVWRGFEIHEILPRIFWGIHEKTL